MFNSLILIGRLVSQPEMITTKEGEGKWVKFYLAVERPYKNSKNEYQIDYIGIKT